MYEQKRTCSDGITFTEVTCEEQNTINIDPNIEEYAATCVESHCELARQNESASKPAETLRIDDHETSPEDLNNTKCTECVEMLFLVQI